MSMGAAQSPRHVMVVGAGMVGLSTAAFLLDKGVEVTVLDKEGVAAGSSWGNAGWLTPSLATPLPEPAVLAYGIKAVISPDSPVYVPPTADLGLARFVAGFLSRSTTTAWGRAMGSLVPINSRALEGFDALIDLGVDAETIDAGSFVAAYRSTEERKVLLEEFRHIEASGQSMDFEEIDGDEARATEPLLSEQVVCGLRLRGQRYIDPGAFVRSLGESVVRHGGRIVSGSAVTHVREHAGRAQVATAEEVLSADAVVLANGAWLGDLAKQVGVRRVVQAGRGYSFTVDVEHVPSGPVYLPAQRVACTPLGDQLRVAGMMEFRRPDAPLDRRRVRAIAEAAKPMLRGVDLDQRRDEWVGSRPCTSDGLALIGASRSPRVYVAGGHGMWGITLGPITGQLLAEQITTGVRAPELAPFDPLR